MELVMEGGMCWLLLREEGKQSLLAWRRVWQRLPQSPDDWLNVGVDTRWDWRSVVCGINRCRALGQSACVTIKYYKLIQKCFHQYIIQYYISFSILLAKQVQQMHSSTLSIFNIYSLFSYNHIIIIMCIFLYEALNVNAVIVIYMLDIVLLFLLTGTLLFLLLTCCCCTLGSMGVYRLFHPIIYPLLNKKHDHAFPDQSQPINTQCYICLQPVKEEVVTTCNHSFCGNCIVQYIDSRNNTAIQCPACRKEVLVLLRRFHATTIEQQAIRRKVMEYNSQHSKEPGIIRSILELPHVSQHFHLLFTRQGLPYLFGHPNLRVILLLGIYALSPFDLLPQAILGPLGLLDDGLATGAILTQLTTVLYGFLRSERARQQ